jgi:hypothetical protein
MSPIFLSIDTRERLSAVAYVDYMAQHKTLSKYYAPAIVEGIKAGDWAWQNPEKKDVGAISIKFDDLLQSEREKSLESEDRYGKPMVHLQYEVERMWEARRDFLETHSGHTYRLALFCVGYYDQATVAWVLGLHNYYPGIYMKVAVPKAEYMAEGYEVARKKTMLDMIDKFIRRWDFSRESIGFPPHDEFAECAF